MLREVFSNQKYRKQLEEQFVILYIDSPMKKSLEKAQIRHNNSLRKRLKLGNKTPCSAVLDSNGEKINIINGYTSVKNYKDFFAKFDKKDDGIKEEDTLGGKIGNNIPTLDNIPTLNSSKWVKGPKKSWYVDFNLALAEAKKTGKKLYVLNTGSDWCGFCIKLREDVLEKGKFKRIAAQHLILVYLDQPRRIIMTGEQKNHNQLIARMLKFGGGVPSAIILSPEGKELGRIGGYMKEESYLKALKSIIDKK
jgi:thioredoxin-related protein